LPLDLNNLESVKAAAATFAQQESILDVLWNNAATGPWRIEPQAKTAQGLEAMMGMHCVATLLFTELLMPQLRASVAASATPGSTRVVWMASIAVEDAPHNGVEFEHLKDGTPDPVRNYAVSKVGNWMLGREMARRHGEEGILSLTANPGNVKAGSYDGAPWIMTQFFKAMLHDTKLGAYTSLFAGLSPEVHMEHNGSYIVPWGNIRPDRDCSRQDIIKAMTPEDEGGLGYAKKVWEWCVEQRKPFV
jgi:NAD(P)-dependent dehydrogenase (short-subunit alcohol dehydrogenase family)